MVVGCRDVRAARAALAGVRVLHLDLASPASVAAFAEAAGASRVRLVVFNAGMVPSDKLETVDGGLELCFATNHVGHFQLARAMAPRLTPGGRFVFVASGSQLGPLAVSDATSAEEWRVRAAYPPREVYSAMRAYGSSKLANALSARHFHALGVDSCSVWPGALVGTGIARHRSALERLALRCVISHFSKSPEQAAASVLWACLAPRGRVSGRCIDDSGAPVPDARSGVTDEAVAALVAVTESLLSHVRGCAPLPEKKKGW